MDPWFLAVGQELADRWGERVYYLETRRNVMGQAEACLPCLQAASQLDASQRAGRDWLYEFVPGGAPGKTLGPAGREEEVRDA